MDLLARRSHFRRELEAKLRDRDYPEEEIEEALAWLEEEGFVDDGRTAREFVSSRLARRPEGAPRLVAELGRRGCDGDLARSVVEEILPEDEAEMAREAAERWHRRKGDRAGRRDPEKAAASLARHLERKGFGSASILGLVREARERWS